MSLLIDGAVALFLVAGGSFALLGSIGLLRLPDFFMRLHGPTKSTTLGVGGMLIASVIHFTFRAPGFTFQEVLVVLFLFTTAPISAYMLARAALHLRLHCVAHTRNSPMANPDDDRWTR